MLLLTEHISSMWNNDLQVKADPETLDLVYRLVSFLMMWTIMIPMFMGCYLKAVSKVDLAVSMVRWTLYCIYTLSILTVGNIGLGITYLITSEYYEGSQEYEGKDLLWAFCTFCIAFYCG